MWWWLPTQPSGNISLRLRQETEDPQYTNLRTGLNVEEFDVDWPWRFAQIFEFFRDHPMTEMQENRPRGLVPGDVIVAGHFMDQPNRGLVIDMTDPVIRVQFENSAYVAMKGADWTMKIAQL